MTLIDEFRAQELHKALGNSVQEAGGSAANTMAGLASLGRARGVPGQGARRCAWARASAKA